MRLTMEQLETWGACNTDDCRSFIGDGIELTGAAILVAHEAGLLDADWLAERILTPPAWAEYERVTALALAEIVGQPAALAVRGHDERI